MTVAIAQVPVLSFTDSTGAPLVGGLLYTYQAGTTTPQATYTDSTGGTPNANPIVLNARGECQVWFTSGLLYKLVLKDAAGNLIWSADNLSSADTATLSLQTLLASSASASAGAGIVGYSRSQSYPTGSIGAAVRNMLPNLKTDFGAVGDGVTDDTAAFQAALDAAIAFNVPAGTYKITSGLNWRNGSRAYGAGMWSAIYNANEFTDTSVIKYAGVGGLNSYVCLFSASAIGVNPTLPLQNCAFTNFHIDGGDLAELGDVYVRSWSGNNFDNISISNTRKVGTLAINCWDTGPRNRQWFNNRGMGFNLGQDYFSWGVATTVDEVTLIDWFTFYCGCNSSGTPYNVFADTGGTTPTSTNAPVESGGAVYGGRSIKFVDFQSAKNSGPGVYLKTSYHPVHFDGGYMEDNGRSSGSSKSWSTWFDMTASSFNVKIDTFFFGSPNPAHRLTGTGVGRVEQSPKFIDCALLGEIVADTGIKYRLINCDRNVIITGQAPTNFESQRGANFRSMGTSGVAVFDATSGSLVSKLLQGVISGVVRNSAGTYTVSLSETYSGANYGIRVSGGDNATVGTTTITSTSFVVTNRVGGVLSDTNARITVEVIGDYT